MSFINGVLIGLGLVAPLGPLNLYIFNNAALQKNFFSTLPVISMAALCDLSLILFAVLVGDVVSQIDWFAFFMMSLGSVFLFYMGIKTWFGAEQPITEQATRLQPVSSQVLTSAMLSLFNPHAILDTFVVIGAISATYVGMAKHAFTLGCMFIDAAWFVFLGTCGFFLQKVPYAAKVFYFINRISSLIMIGLAFHLVLTLGKKVLFTV